MLSNCPLLKKGISLFFLFLLVFCIYGCGIEALPKADVTITNQKLPIPMKTEGITSADFSPTAIPSRAPSITPSASRTPSKTITRTASPIPPTPSPIPPSDTPIPPTGLLAFPYVLDAETDKTAIFTIQADGNGLSQLINEPINSLNPLWSPDGKKLAFLSSRGGYYQLFILNTNNGLIRRFKTDENVVNFSWSRDSKQLAFICHPWTLYGPPWLGKVFLGDIESMTYRVLLEEQWFISYLVWSPTDDQILLGIQNNNKEDQLWLLDLAGNTRFLTTIDGVNFYKAPTWYPGGQMIAYPLFDQDKIVILNLIDSQVKEVAFLGIMPSELHWSPDGKYLAYTSIAGGWTLFILEVDTGSSIRIAKDGLRPTWSPDGRLLAYVVSNKDYNNPKVTLNVYDLKTRRSTLLLKDSVYVTGYPLSWRP